MKLSLFDYPLDRERIAQFPLEERDSSRLLVLHRSTGEIDHYMFKDIVNFFTAGDILVLNDTKVVPARLYGKKLTGGKVEVLLVKKYENNIWSALVKGIKEGTVLFTNGCRAEVKRGGAGTFITFTDCQAEALMKKIGRMPLPPYIKRSSCDNDKYRYQTVYAKEEGAIAAPTAGLHFTQGLLKNVENKGVRIQKITLHVGWGTFKPITSEIIENHKMEEEEYSISPKTAKLCQDAKIQGGKVIAVGTTVVRSLESAYSEGQIREGSGTASLFIYPGYRFNVINAFITNFHLPRSSPLVLTAAFAGSDLLKKAYAEAQARHYRFYSYGDAMLIL
jgi:S-adenosylmethionine:tRNA ribosyltransferase-isomerase